MLVKEQESYYDGLEQDQLNDDAVFDVYSDDDEEEYDEYDDEDVEDSEEDYDDDEVDEEEDDDYAEEDDAADDSQGHASVDYPEYVPEDLIPPEFETEEDELAFYRENYPKLATLGTSDTYVDMFVERYKEQLLNQEDDAKAIKAYYQAVKKGDPKAFIKMHFVDELLKDGQDASLDKDESYSIVDLKMREKYGDDWQERFNLADSFDPRTESGKMAMAQRKVAADIQDHNEKVQEELRRNQPPTPEQIQQVVETQYEEFFKSAGFDRESFNEFIEDIRDWKPTLADMHRAKYFDGYLENVRKQAYDEGKKAAAKTIASSQGSKSSPTRQVRSSTRPQIKREQINNPFELYSRG